MKFVHVLILTEMTNRKNNGIREFYKFDAEKLLRPLQGVQILSVNVFRVDREPTFALCIFFLFRH